MAIYHSHVQNYERLHKDSIEKELTEYVDMMLLPCSSPNAVRTYNESENTTHYVLRTSDLKDFYVVAKHLTNPGGLFMCSVTRLNLPRGDVGRSFWLRRRRM